MRVGKIFTLLQGVKRYKRPWLGAAWLRKEGMGFDLASDSLDLNPGLLVYWQHDLDKVVQILCYLIFIS